MGWQSGKAPWLPRKPIYSANCDSCSSLSSAWHHRGHLQANN
jgi:hypothetical protein